MNYMPEDKEIKEEKKEENKEKQQEEKKVEKQEPAKEQKPVQEKTEEQKPAQEKTEPQKEQAKPGGLLHFVFQYKLFVLIFVIVVILGIVALFLFIIKGKEKVEFQRNIAVGQETLNVDFSKSGPVEPDSKKKLSAIRTFVEKSGSELPTFKMEDLTITEESAQQGTIRFSFDVEVDSEETASLLKKLSKEIELEIKGKVTKMDFEEFFSDSGKSKLKIVIQNIIRSKLQEGMLIRNIYFTQFLVV